MSNLLKGQGINVRLYALSGIRVLFDDIEKVKPVEILIEAEQAGIE